MAIMESNEPINQRTQSAIYGAGLGAGAGLAGAGLFMGTSKMQYNGLEKGMQREGKFIEGLEQQRDSIDPKRKKAIAKANRRIDNQKERFAKVGTLKERQEKHIHSKMGGKWGKIGLFGGSLIGGGIIGSGLGYFSEK